MSSAAASAENLLAAAEGAVSVACSMSPVPPAADALRIAIRAGTFRQPQAASAPVPPVSAPGELTFRAFAETWLQRAREGKDRAAEAARQGREILNKQRENLTTAFDRAREQYNSARETGQDA